MIFSSIFFLFVFLPITLFLYYVVPWKLKPDATSVQPRLLCVGRTCIMIFLMLFSIVFNYLSGIEINEYRDTENTKMLRFVSGLLSS